MNNKKATIGVIGLGVMGSNLLKNMADSNFTVAGYDKDTSKVDALRADAKEYDILTCYSPEEFVSSIEKPRAILLSVPAGKVVDFVIQDLLPVLEKGDIILDGGNSHFQDTNRRQQELSEHGLHFIGLGISGGSEGARKGPSMMPGGEMEAYVRVQPILEAISAKVKNEPCVTYLGKGSVGHYTKMVHNGIEYGLMQILAEAYDIMKKGMGYDNDLIHKVFHNWNLGSLNSYLVEVTADIFTYQEEGDAEKLIDLIMDQSKSKGTGKWTSQDAMNVQAPVPTIDLAVSSRDISKYKEQRQQASSLYRHQGVKFEMDKFSDHKLERAVHAAFYITFAQGLTQLSLASREYNYNISLENVTRIWRGGCIIRAKMLNHFMQAFQTNPDLESILLDEEISKRLDPDMDELRDVVVDSVRAQIPVPCLSSALAYFDSYKSERLPANLIQAQRDYFGSHRFERIDREGTFHANWGN